MDDSKLTMLTGYLARGWALVPLHDVAQGRCSCIDGANCRSAGKHPRWRAWESPSQLVRDAATLATLHREHPKWNWGIATGPASGVWVLDIDLRGFEAYQALCRTHGVPEMTDSNGTPGEFDTYATITASGGLHWYFAMPPDFTPTNSRGRLPVGIDVRGAGGQVVVPPSIAGKGAYAVLDSREVGPAPAWLLDLIRPAAPETPSGGPLPPVGKSSLPGGRGSAYATAAVRACIDELRAAPDGTRNETAYKTACRLIELCNAPWSGLDLDAIRTAWYDAGFAHPDGVVVPASELISVWSSATRHVGDKPADPPAEQDWIGGVMLPLPPGQTTAQGSSGESTGPPFLLPGVQVEQPQVSVPVDPFEHAVAVELSRLAVREEAKRRYAASVGGTVADRMARMREQLLDTPALKARPAVPMLVPGLLARNSLARIVGAPGAGKSFVALDLIGAVAIGKAWAGVALEGAGRVLAMVAEGLDGTAVRVGAWETHHGAELGAAVRWYPEAVQAQDAPAWDAFLLLAAEVGPDLIVIDTQARVTVGVNENDAGEMGLLVDAMERLRAATGACVLLVHHTPLTAERARGTGAVLGAMQTELLVKRDGKVIDLSILKQKDGPEDPSWKFELRPVAAPANDGPFLVPTDANAVVPQVLVWLAEGPTYRRVERVTDLEEPRLLGYAADLAGVAARVLDSPASRATREQFQRIAEEHGVKPSRSAFHKAFAKLLENRVIAQIRGSQSFRYVPVEQRDQLIEPRSGEPDGNAGFYVG